MILTIAPEGASITQEDASLARASAYACRGFYSECCRLFVHGNIIALIMPLYPFTMPTVLAKPTKSFPPPPTTALDFPTDLTNSVLHLAKEADEGRSRVGTGVVLGSEERAPRVRGDIRQAKPGRFPASIPFPACEICDFVEIWFLDPNLYLGSTKIEFEAVRCGKESFLFALLSCSFILGVVGLETKNLRFGCGFADLGFEREMPGFRSFALICC
ncbi:hypothetical protein GW17_00040209 [Ensete ventricosum]|nr:hypothetical protein GW17_00040209 [Ensete ventricosum]